ncbi:MAG: SDR family oxidoreductase [Anaerolineales bacterium]|uniref:SDR family oxidoreductase n=1 Tax=Candidatus Desulfolinea nitratireducens TaxID=2841698 RepID=A0A8J6NLQ1_9CHLR|nr:SDR family oxidoreductase [Candidatus Desulfolinea nitratireducens]MBL6962098.1 SDR family oxidoreductase [Anaerolineales bacterium]
MSMQKVVIITGANRGLGLETARQMAELDYQVILTSRDEKKGEETARDLGVRFHPLDVISAKSIAALLGFVEQEFGRLDVLINNAGVFLDEKQGILDVPEESLRATLETNTFGPLMLARAFIPMMIAQNYGRIVNVSSGMGEIGDLNNYGPSYRLSKLALNGITLMLANAVKGKNVLVNAVCPGWVRTDMGGPDAERDLETGASGIVWAATLPDEGPRGEFFRDGEKIDW